jgi:hypothetical protein
METRQTSKTCRKSKDFQLLRRWPFAKRRRTHPFCDLPGLAPQERGSSCDTPGKVRTTNDILTWSFPFFFVPSLRLLHVHNTEHAGIAMTRDQACELELARLGELPDELARLLRS